MPDIHYDPAHPVVVAPATAAAVSPAEGAVPGTVAPAASEASDASARPRIKVRKPKQRSCDERDDKGKLCAGHLKHWYDYPKEVAALVSPKTDIYRCEFCQTLYRPDPGQLPNSFTLSF